MFRKEVGGHGGIVCSRLLYLQKEHQEGTQDTQYSASLLGGVRDFELYSFFIFSKIVNSVDI